MAPIEPLLPGELAPDNEPTERHAHAHAHNTPSSPSSSPRRRSHSVTAAMLLSNTESLDEPPLSRSACSATTSSSTTMAGGIRDKLGLGGVARRTLGIALLLVVVLLWTVSNFMASYIFSDGTYSKPFFLVYVNTSCFALSLIPLTIRYVMQNGVDSLMAVALQMWREKRLGFTPLKTVEDGQEEGGVGDMGDDSGVRLLIGDEGGLDMPGRKDDEKLGVGETARLSLEFSMLWFAANYFASACLEYTSVGSVTILTSTSSIWTLIFCAITGVEGFTVRKLVGVLASLAGVVLISSVDLSGANDDNRGSFPHKSTAQIAIGDAMAFFSAIVYGIYVTVMKRRVGNEDRVNMPLFFGLVGLFNVVLLWPGFFILHYTGIEPFELPPTGSVWVIIAVNSAASFFSDILWAYAMLLTTPLVVTVGLSLNIPLSLIGEMIQYSQYSSWLYWVGAGIVFISFLFVNNESQEDEGGSEEVARDV
ncbi:hypothetical protein N658DRAFT_521742 [Parathielavia hyrcaniae]|uniref:DUF3955 domain-containing protein n=1 Tax=Parathielavia hyrcaniae TaxID=113614 RepID=A0AAN6Q5E8_9PEZI|nr:hypothetical protein N658DRAFT_521742 [Parathielavia hyrcaniae]